MKTKQARQQARQGDVYLKLVDGIPSNATKTRPADGRIILALGEATGHHHSLEADAADWWKLGDTQYIEVSRPVEVEHQEHGPIPLPPGKYVVKQQRRYTPEAIRRVAD